CAQSRGLPRSPRARLRRFLGEGRLGGGGGVPEGVAARLKRRKRARSEERRNALRAVGEVVEEPAHGAAAAR
ncbi:MAG TPA: hypothetical protein VIT38_00700, partial [Allosphingosinicella sp.]